MCCACSKDGSFFVLFHHPENCLRIWNTQTYQCIRVLKELQSIVRMCCLIIVSTEAQVNFSQHITFNSIFEYYTMSIHLYSSVFSQSHFDKVWCCCVSPKGDKIVSGSQDHSLKVWNVSDGECIMTLNQHTDQVCTSSNKSDYLLNQGSLLHLFIFWRVFAIRGE